MNIQTYNKIILKIMTIFWTAQNHVKFIVFGSQNHVNSLFLLYNLMKKFSIFLSQICPPTRKKKPFFVSNRTIFRIRIMPTGRKHNKIRIASKMEIKISIIWIFVNMRCINASVRTLMRWYRCFRCLHILLSTGDWTGG